MKPDDAKLLAALRGGRTNDAASKAAGVSEAEFIAAKQAWLRRHATIGDSTVKAAVSGRVEILRDRAGVPHVYASETQDLYFGLGVAMAQDRLWQMDRLRRRALGRQAEILGTAYLQADIAHRTVGIDRISAAEADRIDPATRAIVDALTAGINRQIEVFGHDLPVEFQLLESTPEPFIARDIVAIARGFWWSLNGRIDRLSAAEAARLLPTPELRALYLTPEASEHLILPPLAAQHGPAVAPAAGSDDATGSNNWAVGGSHTTTGKPFLCGDPHQPFWVPSSWYEFGLHGPEDNAAGAGHAGLPGLWWGCNGTAAWCLTNNMASTRDLYQEHVDPKDEGKYRDGKVWRDFAEETVAIPVRGEKPHSLTIRSTVRGPVVNALVPALDENGDPPLSLRWVGMEHLDDIRAIIGLARAKSWEGFRNVLRDWSVAVFNWIYADTKGDIGYQMAGRLPIRGRITYGYRRGDEPQDQWQGYIPFDMLPYRCNPSNGHVASANQRVVAPDDPRPIYGAYSQGHRGARLEEVFASAGRMDEKANIALQNDVKNSRAARSVPHILRHLRGAAGLDEFVKVLGAWDYRYTLQSTAPTVFETFMAQWQRHVLGQHLPERLLDLTSQQTGLAALLLEGKQPGYFKIGTSAAVAEVAAKAMASLRDRLGDDAKTWTWGRVHTAFWKHPMSTPALVDEFDVGPAPVNGGSHTLRNTGGELPPNTASSGAEYRIVVDLAGPNSFLAVQNIGNSGIPGSPHYRDQFQPWIDGTYHRVHLTRAGIEGDLESTTVIEPR